MKAVRELKSAMIVALIGILAGCGGGGSNAPAPIPTVSNFQAASLVIGQPDFVSNAPNRGGSPASNTLWQPIGNPLLAGNALYIPDYANNRILGYTTIPTSQGADANFVLGQPNFTSSAQGAPSSTTLYGPMTAVTYNGELLVADFNNNRILIWNTLPMTTQAPADIVVGEANMNSTAGGCSQSTLYVPESLAVVNGMLLVADRGNSRVLIWNHVPTTNGAPADRVLGQGDFTHCTRNDDDQNGTPDAHPTARTLNRPTDVWSDGSRVVVADSHNHRILIWNSFPSANFAPADLVLGQGDFTHSTYNDDNQDGTADPNPSARTLWYPDFIASDGTQLFVADQSNNRVLVWNVFPGTNFAPADRVLGQSNFTRNAYNDDDQNGTPDTHPTARTLWEPNGLAIVGDQLIVDDFFNNRDLIFALQ